GDSNQVGDAVWRGKAEDGIVAKPGVAGLEEQLAARRPRQRYLVHVERRVEVAARRRRRRFRRLERRRVVAETDPVGAAVVAALRLGLERRAFAAVLVFRVEGDAVLPDLPGQAA